MTDWTDDIKRRLRHAMDVHADNVPSPTYSEDIKNLLEEREVLREALKAVIKNVEPYANRIDLVPVAEYALAWVPAFTEKLNG